MGAKLTHVESTCATAALGLFARWKGEIVYENGCVSPNSISTLIPLEEDKT